jgi:hypothetical protein
MSARANSLRLLAPTLALLLAACAGDPILDLERQRARYSATMNGFVVRDDPATGKQEIVLDVLVQFDGQDPLDGVTVDLSVADAAGREKAVRHLWVDTRGLGKGPGKQVTLTLTDLPYLPGDGFFVEVRAPIPAAERGDYREFAAVR